MLESEEGKRRKLTDDERPVPGVTVNDDKEKRPGACRQC